MKIAVVYQSKTGFTERYAKWIAEALSCDCLALKGISQRTLAAYDTVVYGGGIYASRIAGLAKIKRLYQGDLVVFAVGASPVQADGTAAERKEIPHFYFRGGLDFERMGFFSRKILQMVAKNLADKPDKTLEEQDFAEALRDSCDFTEQQSILPLVEKILVLKSKEQR